MKKTVITLLICVFIAISNAYSAGTTTNNVNQNAKNKIVNIGQTVLTKNNLPREVTFNVVENKEANYVSIGYKNKKNGSISWSHDEIEKSEVEVDEKKEQ